MLHCRKILKNSTKQNSQQILTKKKRKNPKHSEKKTKHSKTFRRNSDKKQRVQKKKKQNMKYQKIKIKKWNWNVLEFSWMMGSHKISVLSTGNIHQKISHPNCYGSPPIAASPHPIQDPKRHPRTSPELQALCFIHFHTIFRKHSHITGLWYWKNSASSFGKCIK